MRNTNHLKTSFISDSYSKYWKSNIEKIAICSILIFSVCNKSQDHSQLYYYCHMNYYKQNFHTLRVFNAKKFKKPKWVPIFKNSFEFQPWIQDYQLWTIIVNWKMLATYWINPLVNVWSGEGPDFYCRWFWWYLRPTKKFRKYFEHNKVINLRIVYLYSCIYLAPLLNWILIWSIQNTTVLNLVMQVLHLNWSLRFRKFTSLMLIQTEGRAKKCIQLASYIQITKWGYKAVSSTHFLIRRKTLHYI